MPDPRAALLSILLGYLFGSIPTGVWICRLYGVDVRQVGSGKTGGSNVARAAGRTAATLTIIIDIAKGIVPVLLARWLFPGEPMAVALAGLFSMVGHNASMWIGFKGGAGTMTATGALGALSFPLLIATAPVPLLMTYITRTTSIGSLTAASVLATMSFVFVWLKAMPAGYLVFPIGVTALSWYAHRGNIQRLMTGTERRF
jgi:glycerol-3-phosphate acyltransferase PlsY